VIHRRLDRTRDCLRRDTRSSRVPWFQYGAQRRRLGPKWPRAEIVGSCCIRRQRGWKGTGCLAGWVERTWPPPVLGKACNMDWFFRRQFVRSVPNVVVKPTPKRKVGIRGTVERFGVRLEQHVRYHAAHLTSRGPQSDDRVLMDSASLRAHDAGCWVEGD
jgi:hypothetical protein